MISEEGASGVLKACLKANTFKAYLFLLMTAIKLLLVPSHYSTDFEARLRSEVSDQRK